MARFVLPLAVLSLMAFPACDAQTTSSPSSGPPGPAPASPVPEIAGVRWPPLQQLDRAALASLPPPVAARVRGSPVPVLVPRRPELLAAPVIVTKEHWTSFWARTPEITVSIHATRLAQRYDHIPPFRSKRRVRGAPALITQNEGIWSAAWSENGVTYTLDLECASPDAAPCASDALLLEIAEELVYVGGAGAAQGGAP
jgi:hypothetical protein